MARIFSCGGHRPPSASFRCMTAHSTSASAISPGALLASAAMAAKHTTQDPTDEELMRRYVEGDAAAFRSLFERYGPILLRLTRRHLRDEELAREIVQQTFFQLHRARNDFRQDSRLRPWVLTIAMNLVREHWRRQKRRKMSELDETRHAAPEPLRSPMEANQRVQQLREAMSKLPESQRVVVELHWFQERPFAEVAKLVGSTEGAVRVRAHRAYKKLEEWLGAEIRP